MASTDQAHPSPEQLSAFAVGNRDVAGLEDVESHLSACESCRQTVQQIQEDTFVGMVRQSLKPAAEDGSAETIGLPAARPDTALTVENVPSNLADHPRYRVQELLGKGGMGAVYKAEHKKMNRTVALKVINPDLVANPTAVERFEREVQAAARLNHSNIVAAHDADAAGDLHFLVMEYVEGTDLYDLLKERGPLPIAEACEYIRQTALGLQHAHEQGMVHRDIKPQNLMVTGRSHDREEAQESRDREGAVGGTPLPNGRGSDGRRGSVGTVKILDFGLASLTSETLADVADSPTELAEAPSTLTQVGTIMGTPDYMAPEQANDASAADIRADIYSLGCTLYTLLTGRTPFPDGSALDKIMAKVQQDPKPIRELRPDVPQTVCGVVDKMMAQNKNDRYQTPAEVAKALEGIARPAARTTPQRSAWAWIAVGVGLLLIAGLMLCLPSIVTLFLPTPHGTVKIEISDPKIKVRFGKKTITFENAGETIKVKPGEHSLLVQRGDLKFETPKFTLGRGKNPVLRVAFLKGQVVVKQGGKQLAKRRVPTDADGWVQLFNGKDLSGWMPHPNRVGNWRVEKGVLVGDDKRIKVGSLLLSKRADFNDFHLRAEVHVNSAAADGGIVFDYAIGSMNSFNELNIQFDPKRPKFATGGLFVNGKWSKAPFGLAKPGHWFTVELIVRGKQVISKIDGRIASESLERERKGGRIVLQQRGPQTVVRFRKIEIKKLSEKTPPKDEITLVRNLEGHKGATWAVAYSPNGHWIASGGARLYGDNTARLWTADTGEMVRTIQYKLPVTSVAFSPDSRHLLTCTRDGKVRLVDIADGRVVRTFSGGEANRAVAFSPDGKRIALCDNNVHVFETATGRAVALTDASFPKIGVGIAFPDNDHVVACDNRGQATLWDLRTGRRVRQFPENVPNVNGSGGMALMTGGKHVIIGVHTFEPRIYEIATGKRTGMIDLKRMIHGVEVCVTPDNRHALFAGNGPIVLVELSTGRIITSFQPQKLTKGIAVSPDGKQFVTASGLHWKNKTFLPTGDYALRVWRLPISAWPKKTSRAILHFKKGGPNLKMILDGRWQRNRLRGDTRIDF